MIPDDTPAAAPLLDTTITAQHYRSLFDQHPDAVASFDIRGNFVALNPAAEMLLGYSAAELIGTTYFSLIAESHQQIVFDHFLLALAGTSATYEMRSNVKSGTTILLQVTNLPIMIDGVAIGIYGIAKDITNAAAAADHQRITNERFRNVARATTDTIWDWDLGDDSIWWSDGMHAQFGYRAGDIDPNSHSWSERIHPEDRQRVLRGMRAVIDGNANDWTDEYRFRRHDASYAFVANRGFVIRDNDQHPVRMIGGISDVSARHASTLLLDRLNRALRMLSASNKVLIRARSEQELIDSICRIACDFGGYRMAWVGYAESNPQCSIRPMAHAGIDPGLLASTPVSWSADLPTGQGPSGQAIRSGEPAVMENVLQDARFAAWWSHAERMGFSTVISLPLRHDGKTFGIVTLYSCEARTVPPEEMTLLCELADNLAFGIENRRIEEERRRLQVTVEKVAAAVSSTSASKAELFFEQLTRNMIDAVDAQAGFIARVDGDHKQSTRTVAAITGTEVHPNFVCTLHATLCADLLERGECVMSDVLGAHFPGPSTFLGEAMRSVVGLRLDSADGRPIGMLFVLFSDRLERTNHIRSTLRIFGARASAELERQSADVRLRDQAALLDLATDAIIVRDMQGAVTFWNLGAQRLYGWSSIEAQGQDMPSRTSAETLELHDPLERIVQDGDWRGELLQRRKDGGSVAVEARWTLIRGDDGAPLSILAIETDITQRKFAASEIEHLAFYDRLTDLPNRLLLRDRLQHAVEANERSGRNGALLCINLDNFKTLNDTLGHDMGDLLLQLVAVRLSYCLRASDTVARIGGDEFVILLVDLSAQSDEAASRAKLVAEKILDAFKDPFQLGDDEPCTTPSIGITLFSTATDSIDELLRRADLAMYQAKSAGRNTMRFFDPDMQAAISARIVLEIELRSALRLGQFLLHYQPQVNTTGRPTGAEALVRWNHPQRGMVPPFAFIPIAEETGLILALGSWVLETACLELASWASDPVLAELNMAVNVSARQFRQSGFVNEVLDIVQRSGANPHRLKLELTESLLIDDVEQTILTMTQLKAHGVGFSLDDFGIGYSSLSYLKRLPLDQLKIDQSFVRDILTDANDEAIAGTIVALGTSLGLAVIAEGVETAEQKSRLAGLGCFSYQGYYFSRPVPADVFIAFVRDPVPAG
ncbi:EAL domain-containing protein [Actimicrobium sp. CCI2.3]|uniref:bifunctional diguanylate cyclase/phosphodiesterase n=1 Tax=Actimicrobium sp. CCI2.3 TaxID=3048616 RepID=UPI002AB33CA0|nr:EAL domain-containing protein [Actimicrobium sp. CCI2.3]MDY7574969.1 EAL domain-containing protein [Actimicrobium sp. CCI2.3]MEB0021460.1 EAL domain-containing protein [Actimicrobium sp. CCI2.3]